jgi:hypothetical protein
MRASACSAFVVVLTGCVGAGVGDAGAPDAGSADAGPVCVGVPASYGALCLELARPLSNSCAPTRAAAVAQQVVDCDAGPGFLGFVSVGTCAELESVSWVYGFPGDTMSCFYGPDGGALVGLLNLSDHGVLAAGHVGDCAQQAPASCRDGG